MIFLRELSTPTSRIVTKHSIGQKLQLGNSSKPADCRFGTIHNRWSLGQIPLI